MVLTPLEDYCRPTLLVGLTLTQSPIKFVALQMGLTLPPLKDDWEPTPLMGLTLLEAHPLSTNGSHPTRSPKFVALLMGLTPTRDECKPTLLICLTPTHL